LDADGPASLFHLPISQEAFQQLHHLAEDLNGLQQTNDKDFLPPKLTNNSLGIE